MTFRYVATGMLRSAQLYILVAAIVRGVDYLIRPQGGTPALSWIESAIPLHIWGGAFITCGLLGLAGEAWMQWGKSENRWLASWTAHVCLVALYLTFAVSALIPVMQQRWGFSAPFEWLGYALGHALFVRRRKNAA